MADRTSIEWTDATVNFWWGCTKVGPGCVNCYAEPWAKRTGGDLWGEGVPRRKIKGAVASMHRLDNDYSWWAADAAIGGYHPNSRRRVFVQSMSDLFDLEVPLEWFNEAWATIEVCDRIDIQIVTKRVICVRKRLEAIRAAWPKHAGLVITVTSQAEADRDIPRLLALMKHYDIPWVGLSCEPLLAPIVLPDAFLALCKRAWVIAGGESGPHARPMHPDWPRGLRDQCVMAGVPFLFKQWGAWLPGQNDVHPDFRDRRRVAHWQDGSWGHRECSRKNYVTWDTAGNERHGLCTDFKEYFEVAAWAQRVGKKAAGRLLDGIIHDAQPMVRG